mgnify:CR=1 FL=1
MCQYEKFSDFEYFSNTVKSTSKLYRYLKEDLQSSGDESIIMRDPKNGKLYKCALSLESKDKLKVRGYIGFSLLGRTQYWHRVN